MGLSFSIKMNRERLPTSGARASAKVILRLTRAELRALNRFCAERLLSRSQAALRFGAVRVLRADLFNEIVVNATIDGFESPNVEWVVDGRPVSLLQDSIDVIATWDPEPPSAAGAPGPAKPATARLTTLRLAPDASQITISVGPNAGNVSFRIDLSVTEVFDRGGVGVRPWTLRTVVLEIVLVNQEIIWGREEQDFRRNCERVEHLFAGPAVAVGPPHPGDPANLVDRVTQVIEKARVEGLRSVAAVVKGSRPELATALKALAGQQ